MSVNGVTGSNYTDAYTGYAGSAKNTTADKTKEAADSAANAGVVYEKSEEAVTDSAAKTYTPNTELVNKLKADAEQRTSQLRSLVEQMISKQGNAYGSATGMWQFLASGNYTVDAATKAQAQADIAEDGYWGVEQTSDRILDFAKALSGGDPDKIDEMMNAFEKGFKQATKAWGKELPSISKDTYDAVKRKFDKWREEARETAPKEVPDSEAAEG